MSNGASLFSAEQYARALRVTPRRFRQRMAAVVRGARRLTVRGQEAHAWAPSELPADWTEQLRQTAKEEHCRSVEHLLGMPPKDWTPAVPVARLADPDLQRARVRCAALAPILAAPDAGHFSHAELARRAGAALTALPGAPTLTDRTLREWIKLVQHRAGCGGRFDRLELYVDEKAHAQSEAETTAARQTRATRELLASPAVRGVSRPEAPTVREETDLWESALACHAAMLNDGLEPLAAQRAVLSALEESGVALAKSPAALNRAFRRRLTPASADGVVFRASDCGPANRGGRPKRFDLTDREAQTFRGYVLRKGFALAVEFFKDDAACQPETRASIIAILDHAARCRRPPVWPLSLRRAGHVTEEEKALFRGKKAFRKFAPKARRGNTWTDERGQEHPLLANSLWESDDMSSNEPFSWLDPVTGEMRFGRQSLLTQDVFSAKHLSQHVVGRERDAYRVEDIADHLFETVRRFGLPVAWRLERGSWDSKFIHGVDLGGGTFWGGLDELIYIVHTWSSDGKGGIESSFNLLQKILAHESTSIGRHRGEFEEGTRQLARAQAGDTLAARKFWTIGEYADALRNAAEFFNSRQKQRRAHGRDTVVPDDLYRDAAFRACPADQEWRFCPVKRAATVRNGCVELSVPHYNREFRFWINGQEGNLHLGRGHQILVAFHPGHPERGCHVFNAERGAANTEGWRVGEFLMVAMEAEESAQFSMRPKSLRDDGRKLSSGVASESRAAGSPASVSSVRDGAGNSRRLEYGVDAPLTSPGAELREEKRQRTAKKHDQGEWMTSEAIKILAKQRGCRQTEVGAVSYEEANAVVTADLQRAEEEYRQENPLSGVL